MAAPARLFVALEIPPDIRKTIDGLLAPLRAQKSPVKWERTEKLHVTLRFIGDTASEDVPAINSALDRASSQVAEPFPVRYTSSGFFPNRHRPRIFWIGMDDQHRSATLHDAIEQELRSSGIQEDDREFHPHVTVGRVRDERVPSRLLEDFEKLTLHTDQVIVHEFVLMKSDLRADGSHYSVIGRFPLGDVTA
jgi:2'-5' RNA ligase